jgi:Tfp pilus assembly protein PilP
MLVVGALAACGGDEPEKKAAPPPSSRIAPITAAAPAAAPSAMVDPSKESVLAEARKRTLTDVDFKESTANRDPFRSYLTSFATPVVVNKQHKILLEKFALEELKLVAIISGDGMQPRAMFVDPAGMGVSVVRGDHVSKADYSCTRVAPDRVFFQTEDEPGPDGKPKISERVVELHANENVSQ